MSAQEDDLRAELMRAARIVGAPQDFVPVLERPRDPAFGDWATSSAMVLAKALRQKPRDIATALIAALDKRRGGISSAEIAGPGFINFRVATDRIADGLQAIVADGEHFGEANIGGGQPVNVEFVSANPTGPLHVGHGRQAALGDAISSLLERTGWKVSREFYYNDAGAQIENLAVSVQARVRQMRGLEAAIPEGGYHGEYIREIAARYAAEHPKDMNADDLAAVRAFAVRELRKEQDRDLQAFGVKFDVYFLESSLYSDGKVDDTVRRLKAAGHTYDKDGAVWLKTTEYGDDKDRVVLRSAEKGGAPTYFVPDVAYHVTKWQRGFHRAINVQGADHHSTVTRVRIGLQALDMGIAKGYPEYVLHQMVTVMKAGEEVKISKRAGSYVTVRDLIDEVGRDAVRYFFLMRKGDSQLVFDVDLARAQSEENPVYYVQMAHARMSGIFRVGEINAASITGNDADLSVLQLPEEQELIKALLDFPAIVQGAAEALEPHRVATYLHDLAGKTHTWYHKAHVLNEPEAITKARLVLARAAQLVLRNGLSLLGITAPERM
ncbi:MAG TPA: arginine--tRNA ligase [Gemmatimonadaceae bacterium]